VALFVGGRGGLIGTGLEQKMVSGMVRDVIAEDEGGIGTVGDPSEALMCLDLAESAPREPLYIGFEVSP
jgi:hypothetical protein